MPAPSATRPRVAIVSAVRTPIGKYGGALASTPAVQLGALAAREALRRANLPAEVVPMVYFGHCITAGTGQNPARQVALGAKVPFSSGAATVNMVCGSGMQAIFLGTHAIRAGEFDLALVGGMESMSSAPYLVPGRSRWGLKYGSTTLDDAMLRDGLLDAYGEHEHMGFSGERVAKHFGFTRRDVDEFAARSHQRAAAATTAGTFRDEMVPVPSDLTPGGTGLDHDEGPRGDTTVERLAKLRPSFTPGGVLTAGNSSQLSDGAAAIVLASEQTVEARKLQPLAWVVSSFVGGVDPSDVMEAPIPTVRRHLELAHLEPSQLSRFEHNEAFSSASLAVQRSFNLSEDVFNVHGGAVALGHPVGASGTRIVATLVHELRRGNGQFGLATLCMGGGNGLSLIVERAGS